MEKQNSSKEIDDKNVVTKSESASTENPEGKKVLNLIDKPETSTKSITNETDLSKKSTKPLKIEDKPFEEFITKYLVPGLKSSIEEKGTKVSDIRLIEGNRPVVGGYCWMVFCEISEQRKFWLCFNKDIITSDKTILLAESNSDPSIVESFLIDEKKTTLPLLISRVLQRLNGQKWLGNN